ncbi:50S ribosomal protein L25/general stress protein Ctc [Hydrogenophilus thiooxidans]|uniref:50S ribosomal protein L25/general stress protein Ctc n=1 Tax=Hydrogenophilus thiooxidans TaxID=2820326 RepID=UPI003211C447
MQFSLKAQRRDDQGTRASRRLRRTGLVPAIVYGGNQPAQPIALNHNELYHLLANEAFHTAVITLEIDGTQTSALLRDVQYHPFKPLVLHVDFQRVAADEVIHIKVPLHFVGEAESPAVKLHHCIVNHVMTELDVRCLPKDIPEYIEVNLSQLEPGHSVHVSQLTLPPGVMVVRHGDEDPVVATAVKVGGDETSSEGETAGEA